MKDTNKDESTDELKEDIEKSDGKKKQEKDDSDKKSLMTAFREFRGEFKKIIWPARVELIKKTATVIVTSLSFGLLIFVMDTIFSFGYKTFIDLVTKIQ